MKVATTGRTKRTRSKTVPAKKLVRQVRREVRSPLLSVRKSLLLVGPNLDALRRLKIDVAAPDVSFLVLPGRSL